jgi:uncharacterized membrane protein required for colicin V production
MGRGMNQLDYAIIILNAMGAVYGLRQGGIRMLTSVVSLAAALYFASMHYLGAGTLAERELGIAPTAGSVAGYIVVFVVVFAAVQIIGSAAINLLHMVHMGSLDRIVGAVIGAGVANVIGGLAVMLLAAVLPANAELLKESQVAPRLLAYNEVLLSYIPESAKQAYEENRDDLMRSWIMNAAKAHAASSNEPHEPEPEPSPSPDTAAAR